MDYKNYFKNKKITVLGLGILGRGVGDVKFLAECGADLIVTDLKKAEELKESIDQLEGFGNIKFVLGEHRLEDFRDKDLIIKSAGVPLDSPYVAEAKKNNIPVEMSTALFASLAPVTIVGVTGTRGKTTVTYLIHHILQSAYAGTETAVFLGGNIRGVSTLPFLKDAKSGDIAVLELDSWQLQGFGESKISPNVAVFTNLMKDHLNYYMRGGTTEEVAMKLYFDDKANIFKFQKEGDILVVGEQIAKDLESTASEHAGRAIVACAEKIPKSWKISIPGEHNRANVACAVAAAEALGVDSKIIRKVVENFYGVPGRLEMVREWRGIKIYNDTTATTPDATIVALKALERVKVLIMGGADKTLDMSGLLSILPDHVENIVLLPGTGTDKIKVRVQELGVNVIEVSNLKQAVDTSISHCSEGNILLFSPAFASFGLFKNEYDRGDQFTDLINNL